MPAQFESEYTGFPGGPETENEVHWALLNAYADGEVTAQEAQQVEAWLETNPDLARDLAFLQFTSDTFRAEPEVVPPALLREAILAATTQRPTLARRLIALWTQTQHALTTRPARITLITSGLAAATLLGALYWPRSAQPAVSAFLPPAEPKTNLTALPANPVRENRLSNPIKTPVQVATNIKPTADKLVQLAPLAPVRMITKADKKQSGKEITRLEVARLASKLNPTRSVVPQPVKTRAASPERIMVASMEFSPRPNMGAENLRPTMRLTSQEETVEVQPVHVHVPDTVPTPRVEVASNDTTDTTPKPPDNPPVPEPTPAVQPVKRRIYGRLLTMAPDPRRILTNAAMRQQLDAAQMGLNRGQLDTVQRNMPGITFVGRF